MKKLGLVLLGLLLALPAHAEREFIDLAGRVVVVPDRIERVSGADASANALLLAAAPERRADVAIPAPPEDLFPSALALIRARVSAGVDPEAQVLFCGSADADLAAALEDAWGLPVLCLSECLTDVPRALALLQAALETDLGPQIDFARRALESAPNVPDGTRPRTLCLGVDPLAAAEVLRLAGACPLGAPEDASPEALMGLDPNALLVGGDPGRGVSAFAAVMGLMEDPRLAKLPAIQEGRVRAVPDVPFSWFGPPAGPQRLMGLYWAEKFLFPEAYADLDMAELTRTYLRLFCGLELSEDDMVRLLSLY